MDTVGFGERTDVTRTQRVNSRLAGRVRGVIFSADGRHLAILGDGNTDLWTFTDEGVEPSHILPGHGVTTAAVFLDDDRQLATGGDDGKVLLWDVNSGRQLSRLTATSWVRSLDFAGTSLLATGDDGTCRIWRSRHGRSRSGYRIDRAETPSAVPSVVPERGAAVSPELP